MKEPCEHCPFRKDVVPYLTPARGMQLATLTRNPRGVFYCHETVRNLGGKGPKTMCRGFAILRAQEAGNRFVKEDETTYRTMGDMILAYTRSKHGT